MERIIISLRPKPPYNFDLTASYAVYFRGSSGTESYYGGVFRRLLDIDSSLCLAGVRSISSLNSQILAENSKEPVIKRFADYYVYRSLINFLSEKTYAFAECRYDFRERWCH